MIGTGWILSAIWFIVEWPRPYSKGMWRKQWGWWFIVFLSVWLWACDDGQDTNYYYLKATITPKEPPYSQTIESLDNFTDSQKHELLTKGYVDMRIFYHNIEFGIGGNVWIQSTTPSFGSSYIFGCCYGGTKYIAVSVSGTIAYSADGNVWTQASTPSFGGTAIHGVTYGGSKYVAVGQSGDRKSVV